MKSFPPGKSVGCGAHGIANYPPCILRPIRCVCQRTLQHRHKHKHKSTTPQHNISSHHTSYQCTHIPKRLPKIRALASAAGSKRRNTANMAISSCLQQHQITVLVRSHPWTSADISQESSLSFRCVAMPWVAEPARREGGLWMAVRRSRHFVLQQRVVDAVRGEVCMDTGGRR